jgi:lysophospholipase L1-like esterase
MVAQQTSWRVRWRWLLFRVAAVLIGLSPLLAAEWVFTLLDWGRSDRQDDPYVGFDRIRPLFALNEQSQRYEIAPARQPYFQPDGFAAQKADNEFRVFCLGGSTVQGNPYGIETSFTTWLELTLNAADRRRQWQVVNCGGISYASYRLVPILEEVLRYQPDLIIVCSGQNEFLEDRTYRHLKTQPAWLRTAQSCAARCRTYWVLRAVIQPFRGATKETAAHARPTLPTEVDTLLDYRDGLRQYHRDEVWRQQVIEHYAANLRRIVAITRQAHVPLILVHPVSNLRDCPPFKSEHRDRLSDSDLARWEHLWTEARQRYAHDLRGAVERLEAAARIDDQYAALQYQMGQCFDALGETERARECYVRAKELDICPLRMLEPMHDELQRIARQTSTPVIDARQLIAAQCRDGIVDDSWLVDHVHPSIRGHQCIAAALTEELMREGLVVAEPDWQARRDAAYAEQLASLDELYYQRGQQRLRSLQIWARGRSTLERPAARRPQ